MTIQRLQALTLATAGCALLLTSQATPQATSQEKPGNGGNGRHEPVFAAPQRIRAGEAFLGEGRLYPSPVLHDVDGDQLQDIVVGDLFGKITFAPRLPAAKGKSKKAVLFGAEKELKDRSGAQLKFQNW